MSVFQALQLGHLPSHLELVPPHSEQTKTLFSLAMAHITVRNHSFAPLRCFARGGQAQCPAFNQSGSNQNTDLKYLSVFQSRDLLITPVTGNP
jgi:hypothetical protein